MQMIKHLIVFIIFSFESTNPLLSVGRFVCLTSFDVLLKLLRIKFKASLFDFVFMIFFIRLLFPGLSPSAI